MSGKLLKTPNQSRYDILRFTQLVLCELILFVVAIALFDGINWSVFWPITLALVIPTLFAEPYFTAPRAALMNSVGLAAGYFASDRGGEDILWRSILILAGVVVIGALVTLLRSEKPGQSFHFVATRLGRAPVLGSVLTLVLVLQVAEKNDRSAAWLVIALGIVYGVLLLDWSRLIFGASRASNRNGTISSVFAPNQILVRSFGTYGRGDLIKVAAPNGIASGYIAEDFASDTGSQYRIVLDRHWRKISDTADVVCTIDKLEDEDGKPAGFAIEGSTELTIRMSPVARLSMGTTLSVRSDDGPLLYQVAGLKLEEETWSQSAALVSRVHLVQVGCVDDAGHISSRPYLPDPYEPVLLADTVSAKLSSEAYIRIGLLKGTNIPVGVRRDWAADHGHLAVLGMSGMGKTSVAAKLTQIASDDDKFVILDETSEYRTRLGYTPKDASHLDWTTSEIAVCEPGGHLAQACSKVVGAAMAAAHTEYSGGTTPKRRFLLLEEAHGYLPEWNFTTKPEADAVNLSSRYILQARKFNISFLLISQRTAVISKSAISQCENYIILRTIDQTSLDYIESIVGSQMKRVVAELGRHEAICVGPIFNSDAPVIVKLDPPA